MFRMYITRELITLHGRLNHPSRPIRSVCSPIIANIYMHYMLVWWFKERIQPLLKGYSGLIVYADDFVACFQYKQEAERFYELLKVRMAHFGLEMEESKTRLIEFGRFAAENRRKRGDLPETSVRTAEEKEKKRC